MTDPGSADRDSAQRSEQAARFPRMGVVGAGVLSLLLASSLLLLFPIGLVIAPLAMVPVAQRVGAGQRGIEVWGWVVLCLVVLAVLGIDLLGVPIAVFLMVYLLVVVVPVASTELWRALAWSEGRWVAVTTLAGAVLSMVVTAAAAWPRAPLDALSEWWQQAVATVEEARGALGMTSGELELALDAVQSVVPWTLVAMPVVYLVVLLFWIRPRLPVLGFRLTVEPFERFRGDDWLAAGFAASGIGAVMLEGTPRWVAVNLLIGVLVLYFVQGLAMIRAHVARWIGRGWLVRWGVALLCLQGPLPLMVAALGIADGFYSLRPRLSDDGGD